MAKYVKTEQGYIDIKGLDNTKMDKNDPVGTGSFSMGRRPGSVIGSNSHAEGTNTTASGSSSHAEGFGTTASGSSSHAEGVGTKASSENQHVQGKYNIEDSSNVYADIIGNGTLSSKSNASTVDWHGNAWYAGDVYVGSTSGTNKDSGSKKLATEEYVNNSTANIDIPTTLPNPNALTFTGAVTGAYDGSVAKTVNIPNALADLTTDSTHRLVTDSEKSTWNAKAEVSAIPTKVSQLTNDSGYLTSAPVTSVNGKTGAVTLTIPSKTSDITNDSDFATNSDVTTGISTHNSSTEAHNDIRLLVQELTNKLNTLADSDDTTLDQLSEIVSYIKNNKSLIDDITTSKVSVADIIDNLTTSVTNKPLSAKQGVALKALIDAIVVPTKLPNPNAITFTGAAEGTYDGSSALTVEIPSAPEIPTQLPNPNALQFTGAVTGSYDGSVPLTVEIPRGDSIVPAPSSADNGKYLGCKNGAATWMPVEASGGGDEDKWELINSIEISETVNTIMISADKSGNPFSLKRAIVVCELNRDMVDPFTYINMIVNGHGVSKNQQANTTSSKIYFCKIFEHVPGFGILTNTSLSYSNYNWIFSNEKMGYKYNDDFRAESINYIEIVANDGNKNVCASGKIDVFGVRA